MELGSPLRVCGQTVMDLFSRSPTSDVFVLEHLQGCFVARKTCKILISHFTSIDGCINVNVVPGFKSGLIRLTYYLLY